MNQKVRKSYVPAEIEVYRLSPEEIAHANSLFTGQAVRDEYTVSVKCLSNSTGYHGSSVDYIIMEAGLGYLLDDMMVWESVKPLLPDILEHDWGRVAVLFECRDITHYDWEYGVEYDTEVEVLGKLDMDKLVDAVIKED